MYTSIIGRTFLNEYNRRNKASYNPKDFFDKVYNKLFFDHERYLMWGQNSPFVQGISKKKPYFKKEERRANLLRFHDKVEGGSRDASIALGYPASDEKDFATTSGLVSDMTMSVSKDEIYLSWIGASLAAGVAGGYAILFNDPEILYVIFEGWKIYRKYLNDPALKELSSNKIITWNGQWLTYKFSKKFRKDYDFLGLKDEGFFFREKGEINAITIEWSRLFFSLSRKFGESTLLGYVFSLGDVNKTMGVFPFYLKTGTDLISLYKQLWGEKNYLKTADVFESLFGKHIKRACELGSIGLQALEPKNITQYFTEKNLDLIKPAINPRKGEKSTNFKERKNNLTTIDEKNIITYRTYKTWLIAMLNKNKEELDALTSEIASLLVRYRAGARKMDRKNLIEKGIFASSKKNTFIESLTAIVSDSEVDIPMVEKLNHLKKYVHYLSNDEFVYFWLLLKFDYAYQERIS